MCLRLDATESEGGGERTNRQRVSIKPFDSLRDRTGPTRALGFWYRKPCSRPTRSNLTGPSPGSAGAGAAQQTCHDTPASRIAPHRLPFPYLVPLCLAQSGSLPSLLPFPAPCVACDVAPVPLRCRCRHAAFTVMERGRRSARVISLHAFACYCSSLDAARWTTRDGVRPPSPSDDGVQAFGVDSAR